jgi:oxygen-dependent protoporphyrinogen oxidase
MGVTAKPLSYVIHKWPKSMPQYVVGHGRRLGYILELLKHYDGLNVVGNAYDGVGIPDCVRQAKQMAQQIGQKSV